MNDNDDVLPWAESQAGLRAAYAAGLTRALRIVNTTPEAEYTIGQLLEISPQSHAKRLRDEVAHKIAAARDDYLSSGAL